MGHQKHQIRIYWYLKNQVQIKMVKSGHQVLLIKDLPAQIKILRINLIKIGLNTVIPFHLISILDAGVNSNVTRSAVFKHGQIMN